MADDTGYLGEYALRVSIVPKDSPQGSGHGTVTILAASDLDLSLDEFIDRYVRPATSAVLQRVKADHS